VVETEFWERGALEMEGAVTAVVVRMARCVGAKAPTAEAARTRERIRSIVGFILTALGVTVVVKEEIKALRKVVLLFVN
jgi:hypothetical protein